MAREFSVVLQMKDACNRAMLTDIIGGLEGFYLKPEGSSGITDLYVFEVGDQPEQELQFIDYYIKSNPSTEVLLTAREAQPQLLLAALKLGVREFLLQPLQADEVRNALQKLRKHLQEKASRGEYGHIISVMGAKGGCGGTTVSVNIAAGIAKEKHSVALVDLNLEMGTSNLFVGLSNGAYNIADLARNAERLDPTFLLGVLSRHSTGVYILPPPGSIEQVDIIRSEHVQRILELLQQMFDFVVIDNSYCLMPGVTLPAIDLADDILLVLTADVLSLYNTRRYLAVLESLGYPQERVKLVINRFQRKDRLVVKEAARVLKKEPFWHIANNYHTATCAVSQGKPILEIAPNTDIGHDLMNLARKFVERRYGEAAKSRRQGSIFNFFARARNE